MESPAKSVALWLADVSNEFQQMMKADVEAVCRKNGLGFEVHFTGYEIHAQVREIRAALARSPRAGAFLVLAARDRGLAHSLRLAAAQGVAWFFLNGVGDDLQDVRRDHPGMALATVTADERETGRIQGRQFRALVGDDRLGLYVQGGTQSFVARERTAGLLEVTRGAPFAVTILEGGWDPAASRETVRRWLSTVSLGILNLDLVGCQNDPLALAAVEALQSVALSGNKPELGRVPVIGCDGTPGLGQRKVQEGALLATVVLPPWAGIAAQQAADFLLKGSPPPPVTLVVPRSFPPEQQLQRPSSAGPGASRRLPRAAGGLR
jgi:ABC-type sugar transport system substrate-binding protein